MSSAQLTGFHPVAPVPSYADVRLDEGTDPAVREVIETARREALAAVPSLPLFVRKRPETTLLAFESGLVVDASAFVAAHASDRTPTSIGVPAIRRSPVDAVVEATLDKVWSALQATGSAVVDAGVRCAFVRRDGLLCLIALHELSLLECASILAGGRP